MRKWKITFADVMWNEINKRANSTRPSNIFPIQIHGFLNIRNRRKSSQVLTVIPPVPARNVRLSLFFFFVVVVVVVYYSRHARSRGTRSSFYYVISNLASLYYIVVPPVWVNLTFFVSLHLSKHLEMWWNNSITHSQFPIIRIIHQFKRQIR